MVDAAREGGTDLELLARWREERDAEAFRELVARHAAMVHATCRRILGNAADAQEVSQECFLRLAQEGVDVRSSLAGYLHHLALGLAKNRVQSESRRRRRERAAAPRLTSSAEPGWDEVQVHIDEAIDALPEETRGIIVARYLEQETIESIAARLGVTRRQVGYRAEKGIEAVRRHLRRRGIGLGAALLASLLAERALTAAPEALVRALGKRALAGNVKLALPAVAASGGTLAAKALLGAAAAIILLLAGSAAIFDSDEESRELASVDPEHGATTLEPQDARALADPTEPGDATAAPIAAAPPAEGTPQELSVDVLWAHSEKPATGSEVIVRESATGSTRRRHVELDGRARWELPETWRSATVIVENGGADPVTTAIELPAEDPLRIRLSAVHSAVGTVTDRETGAPIAGAELRVEFPEFDSTTSGPGGAFELLLPGRGRIEILVRAPGYAVQRPVLEVTDTGTSELSVQLDPAFEALVRVFDVQGIPLAGVSVCTARRHDFGTLGFHPDDSVLTDDSGTALVPRISRRAPQELRFTLDGYRDASLRLDPVDPSVARIERSVMLERDERSPQCIEGVITDAGGRPLEGIHVRWRHSLDVRFSGGGFEDPGVTTITDSSGRYRVRAHDIDDECVIAVAGDGWAPVIRSGIRSGPPERPGRFDLALEAAHWLAGRVVDDEGLRIVNARIVVTPRGGGFSLHCEVYPEVCSETRSDEQGLFSLANLPPPPFDIDVDPPKNRSLVWRDPGDLPTNREVELVLHSIGELRGRVVDAASGAPVTAFSIRRRWASGGFWSDSRPVSFSAEDGRFVLPKIPRSEVWALRIEAEGYLVREISPAPVLDPGEEGGETILLERGSTRSGIVVGAESGEPIAGVAVHFLNWPRGEPVFWSPLYWTDLLHYQHVTTGADGRFDWIDDGSGWFLIQHGGYRRVVLPPEERERHRDGDVLRIELRPGESIVGTLLLDDGAAQGASVGLFRTPAGMERGTAAESSYGYDPVDGDGAFGWDDLDPGPYELELPFPGDQRYRRPIALADGEHVVIDLAPELGSSRFRGRLVDASGSPHDRIRLVLRPRFSWSIARITCDVSAYRDGAFDFDRLRPGVYAVEAFQWDRGSTPLPDVTIEGEVLRDLVLELP